MQQRRKDLGATEIIQQAAAEVGERAPSRDSESGERSMARAVAAFNGLVGGDTRLSETEGWLFMCCLKMARATRGQLNIDDYIDLAGYAGLAGESAQLDDASAPAPGESTGSWLDGDISPGGTA